LSEAFTSTRFPVIKGIFNNFRVSNVDHIADPVICGAWFVSELRLLKEKRESNSEFHLQDLLLAAKMQSPAMGNLISRPRLLARLELATPLTLVTAPAGCGKTALLCDWVAQHPRVCSWLTLDETDNDPQQFLAYVAASLNLSIEVHSPEAMLIAVLNEATYEGKPHTLILDNFHLIKNGEVQRAVAFLLDHCPPSLRLIIAGRSLPPLPVARLRVRGKLNHIRSTDLAFSQQETVALLEISSPLVDDLLSQMEGWAAGLQFITLAAAESTNPDEQVGLVRTYVREFVVQEILSGFSPDVQNFLLQTSLLETLTPERCDSLTGSHHGFAMLELLLAEGSFVRRYGQNRYRYTPFFQTALQEQLALNLSTDKATLVQRATAINRLADDHHSAKPTNDLALSQREHEVLTMLADGLSSPEIARRMIIAVSTVKTHIKHIYRKLEVDNRYQAVKRAQELNIIQIEMEERMRKMFR
jgi:ATP/maltotriose-dependent transcriptional regulator MalT